MGFNDTYGSQKSCENLMDSRLANFLREYRVTKGDGAEFTHTSMMKPMGSYCIPDSNYAQFMDLYKRVISENGVAGLTERPPSVVPLIIDVDLRFDAPENRDKLQRIYTSMHIQQIVQVYQNIIRELVDPTADINLEKLLMCCVLEKAHPRIDSKTGKMKDGFHLHFPNFYTEKWVQSQIIRNKAIAAFKASGTFNTMPVICGINKIIDESIPNVQWLMYGSRKPDDTAGCYKVTRIYDHKLDSIEKKRVFRKCEGGDRDFHLPEHLSIRRNEPITPLVALAKPVERPKKYKKPSSFRKEKDEIFEDLVIAQQLMPMIDNERFGEYPQWIELGWILYNVSEGDPKGLEIWIDKSSQCDGFEDGVCERKWYNDMKVCNFTLGTLKFMAKTDSPGEYEEWKNQQIDHILLEGMSRTHNDIAHILYMMYDGEYVCADVDKKPLWYKFYNHRWHISPGGLDLSRDISSTLVNKYKKLQNKFKQQARDSLKEEDKAKFDTFNTIVGKLIKDLKTSQFKNNVMKECTEYFYDPLFLHRMDENSDITCFENGVYDSRNDIFRDGRPDDYCTKCTNICYAEYADNHPKMRKLNMILRKIFPNDNIFSFFSQVTGDHITRRNNYKLFLMWIGVGDNGKGVLSGLMQKSFGRYFAEPNTTILTGPPAKSSAPSPDIVELKGAAIMMTTEPNETEKINKGTLKKFTGGDTFEARLCNSNQMVKIDGSYACIMQTNHAPDIDIDDAVRNRMRLVPFESRFVSKGYPEKLSEQFEKKLFPKDRNIKREIKDGEYASVFMWWIIQQYRKYRDQDLIEVPEVQNATDIYSRDNDVYQQFADKVEKVDDPTMKIRISELYEKFKTWYALSHPGHTSAIANENAWKQHMSKKIGKPGKHYWVGYVYNDADSDEVSINQSIILT